VAGNDELSQPEKRARVGELGETRECQIGARILGRIGTQGVEDLAEIGFAPTALKVSDAGIEGGVCTLLSVPQPGRGQHHAFAGSQDLLPQFRAILEKQILGSVYKIPVE
jgi:hypothetical protein